MKHPWAAMEPTRASEPAVVIMRSAVSMLSLISTGMPCSGPRMCFCFAFLVERFGNGYGVGIYFDDAVEGRTVLVDDVDAREIFVGEGMGGEAAGGHAFLHLGHGHFIEFNEPPRLLVPRCAGIV